MNYFLNDFLEKYTPLKKILIHFRKHIAKVDSGDGGSWGILGRKI